MGDLDKYIQKVTNLDSYIENALNHEVAEVVRRILTETARELVYDAYTPRFVSRRGDPGGDYDGNTHGGITDPNSVKIEARGNTLTATDNAGWQQLWGGNIPSERLVDAIASGDRRFNMHRAGTRTLPHCIEFIYQAA